MDKKTLFNRDFLLLFQGQLVSGAGTAISMVGLIFWIKHSTDSATLVGLVSMAAALPAVLLGPLGGAIADRFSRKKIIVYGDFGNGFLMLVLALAFYIQTDKEIIIVLLFIITLFSSAINAVFRPTVMSSVPDLVPRNKIDAANGLMQVSMQVSLNIGQALGGIFFTLLGAPLLILINAITFIGSAVSELFISLPHHRRSMETSLAKTAALMKMDMIIGLNYVKNKAGLLDLFIASAVINLFTTPITVLLPFFVEDTLGTQPVWYGVLMACFAVGMLLGSAAVGIVRIAVNQRSAVYITLQAVFSIGLILCSQISSVTMAMPLFLVGGISLGFSNVLMTTVVQLSTPSELRGRVLGLFNTITFGLIPIAMGCVGFIADVFDRNIPAIYLISGLFSLLAPALLLVRKPIHRLFCEGHAVAPAG